MKTINLSNMLHNPHIVCSTKLVSYLHLKSRLDIPAWWTPVLSSVLEL